MTIDDPTLAERPFTETHDRILHALVEQVHDMSLRLAALEASASQRDDASSTLAPPEVPPSTAVSSRGSSTDVDLTARPSDRAVTKTRSTRAAGWQPARR